MSNPRPIGLSSAMLLAMLAALGSAALVVIGGFANPMTAKSDLIVAGDAGTATRLAAAGAADGAVLTVAGNTVQWATASGSSLPVATAAGEIPVSAAAGTTYVATGAAGVRAAIGLGQPASLAAQQRVDAMLRRGPLAMRSTGVQGTSASTTTDSTPSILKSTSGVITLYSPQAGGYGSAAFAASGVAATRGWYMSGFGSTFRIGLTLAVVQPIDFTTFLGSVGWHSLAWAIAADGNSVRYSIDGAAAATLVPASIPLAPVARNAADTVYIGSNGSSTGTTPAGLAYLALWESILSDDDLVAASSSPSAGAPSLPSTPAWEWAASAFGNANAAVRIDGTDHAVLSTPAWWMP